MARHVSPDFRNSWFSAEIVRDFGDTYLMPAAAQKSFSWATLVLDRRLLDRAIQMAFAASRDMPGSAVVLSAGAVGFICTVRGALGLCGAGESDDDALEPDMAAATSAGKETRFGGCWGSSTL